MKEIFALFPNKVVLSVLEAKGHMWTDKVGYVSYSEKRELLYFAGNEKNKVCQMEFTLLEAAYDVSDTITFKPFNGTYKITRYENN